MIDANGRRIPWTEVSRVGTEELGDLMRQVVNRLYTFQAKAQPQPHQGGADHQPGPANVLGQCPGTVRDHHAGGAKHRDERQGHNQSKLQGAAQAPGGAELFIAACGEIKGDYILD